KNTMADSKLQRLALTTLHVVLAALLIWAMRRRSYNYYVFLRFMVCGGSIYIAWYWRRQAWFVSVVFVAMAILFNPIAQFTFSKETWSIIDFVTSIVCALFGLAYFRVAGSLVGASVLCMVGVMFAVNAVGDVASAIRLASSGVRTTGTIVDVQERVEDCDSCPGHIRRTYDVTYHFSTESGQSIEGLVNVGYDPTESEGEHVDIVYNPTNSTESRLAHARQSTVGGA